MAAVEAVVLNEKSVSQVYCRSVALFAIWFGNGTWKVVSMPLKNLSGSLSAQDCCLLAA